MNLFDVDPQPGASLDCCAGFDCPVTDATLRRAAGAGCEPPSRADGGAVSGPRLRSAGAYSDILVFSGASRLTRFVQTTHVS